MGDFIIHLILLSSLFFCGMLVGDKYGDRE